MIEAFLNVEPSGKTEQQKGVYCRGGKPYFYVKDEVQAVRDELMYHLKKYAPEKPYDGPLCLHVQWYFPMIKGVKDGQPKHTKPDTSNLLKGFEDVMEEAGFFTNDSRIAESSQGKYWSKKPGIWFKLYQIDWQEV